MTEALDEIRQISPTTYDFQLPAYDISDLNMCNHALVLYAAGGVATVRHTSADVASVSLCLHDQPIITMYNEDGNEQIVQLHQLQGLYHTAMDFFRNGQVLCSRLTAAAPYIRVNFWREPVTPFWIEYNRLMPNYHSDDTMSFDNRPFRYVNGTLVTMY